MPLTLCANRWYCSRYILYAFKSYAIHTTCIWILFQVYVSLHKETNTARKGCIACMETTVSCVTLHKCHCSQHDEYWNTIHWKKIILYMRYISFTVWYDRIVFAFGVCLRKAKFYWFVATWPLIRRWQQLLKLATWCLDFYVRTRTSRNW
jgi:hypothetical protein